MKYDRDTSKILVGWGSISTSLTQSLTHESVIRRSVVRNTSISQTTYLKGYTRLGMILDFVWGSWPKKYLKPEKSVYTSFKHSVGIIEHFKIG